MESVEVQSFMVQDQTGFGPVERRHEMDRVYVQFKDQDGNRKRRLAGYVPWKDEDPFQGVFHPLSGFPPELVADVVDKCDAIKGTLDAPVPEPEPEDEGSDIEE